MKLEDKIKVIDKLIVKKENILLDYISFNKKHIFGTEDIFKKWKKSINTNIPIKFYLHIPFCASICKYCMYNTKQIKNNNEIDNYIDNLIEYLENFKNLFKNTEFNGIYIGGGTPSLLGVEQMNKLFIYIFKNFSFKDNYYKTIELNPASITFEKLDILKKYGFNRVSFGIQSFNKKTLELENRTYVSKEKINKIVKYSKKLGFLDINIDIIAGLNEEQEEEILKNLEILKEINPFSITVYTILKDIERSKLYQDDNDLFYEKIKKIYEIIVAKLGILENFNKTEWSNVLGFTLKNKDKPKSKLMYDAHTEEKESLFGIGYKSYSKIWGIGMYELIDFTKNNFKHNFEKSNDELEMYSYLLQAFQFEIIKKDFNKIFGIQIDEKFEEELSFLENKNIIENKKDVIKYIGDKKYIGYYGLFLLDFKNLVKFIRLRFYEKK